MIYLLFCVLSSTLIFVVFKLFERFKINILQAITVNYITAFITGIIVYDQVVSISQLVNFNWFYYTLFLGILFIIIFFLMAITTQKGGLSVVSIATKMSMVIPILFGLFYYKEDAGALKIIGIILALIAVYFSSLKAKSSITVHKKYLIYPVLVFMGSGIIDTSLKFLEDSFVAKNDVPLFSATIFLTAAIIGIIIIAVKSIRGGFKIEFKNIIAGVFLGIPNYFSIYFLLQALRSEGFESSDIFTLNNVAVVMLSTIIGILLFKEKLIPKNWIGIFLAILSILFIFISN
ncbi:MAG: drug/metabolite transporter (DMT)-like permease [Flavobacteriaceae bacterium]|uniref:EamA family transporter n=1 Tax=Candidatus Marifrigoribacter sp. Uisw_064 TaxID=3230970 RepID=UPI003AE9E06B